MKRGLIQQDLFKPLQRQETNSHLILNLQNGILQLEITRELQLRQTLKSAIM